MFRLYRYGSYNGVAREIRESADPRHREGQIGRYGHAGSLSSGRLEVGHHLHRRSHEFNGSVISRSIVSPYIFHALSQKSAPCTLSLTVPRNQLLRPCPSTERHHPAAPALCLRAAQVGGNAAAEARQIAPEGIGMGDYCQGDCGYE